MKKILFISHDASRAGAPKLALELISRMQLSRKYQVTLVLLKGGELLDDFEEVCERVIVWVKPKSLKSKIKQSLTTLNPKYIFGKSPSENVVSSLRQSQYDLIYSNSAKSSILVNEFKQLDPLLPVVQHIHELEFMIQSFCNPIEFEKSKDATSKYIACSKIVEQNLISNHHIDKSKIEIVYEYLSKESLVIKDDVNKVRSNLGMSSKDFMVLGCGTFDLRKGVDLFVKIANYINSNNSNNSYESIYFIWLGGKKRDPLRIQMQIDIDKLGLSDKVQLLESEENSIDYINSCDVFAMTSREDPFPLVCLEAAFKGKPIVCFKDAIGSEEFIDDSVGGVVDYLDTESFAKKIIEIRDSKIIQNYSASVLPKRVENNTAENAFVHISKIIDDCIIS